MCTVVIYYYIRQHVGFSDTASATIAPLVCSPNVCTQMSVGLLAEEADARPRRGALVEATICAVLDSHVCSRSAARA